MPAGCYIPDCPCPHKGSTEQSASGMHDLTYVLETKDPLIGKYLTRIDKLTVTERLTDKGWSASHIAEVLGVTSRTIVRWRSILGISQKD